MRVWFMLGGRPVRRMSAPPGGSLDFHVLRYWWNLYDNANTP
jgi:hypothetical protein